MGTGVPAKFIGSKKIAAAVAYICLAGFDKVGVASFSDTLMEHRSPVRGRRCFSQLLEFIRAMEPRGNTDINTCLSKYADFGQLPGIAVVLSDLFDPKGYKDGLRALAHRNFDVHLIQVLDHEEIFWSTSGVLGLTDVETGGRKTAYVDRSAITAYRNTMDRFMSDIGRYCDKYGISHCVYDTRIPFEDFLLDYLTTQSMFRTKR
jgi:uncharacterized protein (DUF58 family)